MEKKFKVVALIGSTRHQRYFMSKQKTLTLEGYIVLTPGIFSHAIPDARVTNNSEIEQMLIEMGKQRIDMADCVYVVNPDCYIGHHTQLEIDYAKSIGKPIDYFYTEEN